MPMKDKSVYHTNPEEALSVGKDLKSKKIIGMHWGTVILSLEPIMEPPKDSKKTLVTLASIKMMQLFLKLEK